MAVLGVALECVFPESHDSIKTHLALSGSASMESALVVSPVLVASSVSTGVSAGVGRGMSSLALLGDVGGSCCLSGVGGGVSAMGPVVVCAGPSTVVVGVGSGGSAGT